MGAERSSRGRTLFPAVCIQFRTANQSSKLVLSQTAQVFALPALVVAAVALAYLGVNQIGYVQLIGDEKLAIARVERANVDLQDDLANLRDRLAAADRDRAVAEDRLSALASQANTLRGQLELTETKPLAIQQEVSEHEPPGRAAKAGQVEPEPFQPAPSEATPARDEVGVPNLPAEAMRSTKGSLNSATERSVNLSEYSPRQELMSSVCFRTLGRTGPKAVPSYCHRELIPRPGPSIRTS